jgi:hypothetical protein
MRRTVVSKYTILDKNSMRVSIDDEPEQLSLLKSELFRAIEFSNSALNKSAGAELRRIAREMGFDPEETVDIGIEEEE